MEAVPLASTSADDCAGALIVALVTRFGVPGAITSDRGPQFCGAIWRSFCATIGAQYIPTTAYHPKGNSLFKHLHRHLKDTLSATVRIFSSSRWRQSRYHPCTMSEALCRATGARCDSTQILGLENLNE